MAPDVIVLDLGLPDKDGKDVIREIRAWSKVPIIVLSARDRESEKIDSLDLGADDYVNKPFGIGELMARIRASLRNRQQSETVTSVFRSGGIVIDTLKHVVEKDGKAVHLTPKEFDLMSLLVKNSDRVLTHRQILTAVWGPAHTHDVQYLRVFIGQLRHKIEANPADPELVLTESGIGYRFKVKLLKPLFTRCRGDLISPWPIDCACEPCSSWRFRRPLPHRGNRHPPRWPWQIPR